MSAVATGSKFMTFRLATETYGLQILQVRELVRLVEITRVPGAPAFVRGVVNLRGKVIPVIDLRHKLGIERIEPGEQAVIMVVNAASGLMGLLVDEVLDVVALTPAQIEPPTAVATGDHAASLLSGIGKPDQRLIFLIDLERVLATTPTELRAP